MRRCFTYIFTSIIGMGIVHAQETLSPAGGDGVGIGGNVSYSVGQIDFETNSTSVGSVALGVQQPFEISVVVGLDENQRESNYSVYPNPTSSSVILSIQGKGFENHSYSLANQLGQRLQSGVIDKYDTQIRIENWPKGIYFLILFSGTDLIRTFKIVKN